MADEDMHLEEQYAEIMRLPQAPIDRIIKECLPQGNHASKETRAVFARAVSVFVLCLGTASSENARSAKRKAIGLKDVRAALKSMNLMMPEIDVLVEKFMEQMEKNKGDKENDPAEDEAPENDNSMVNDEEEGP